MSAVEESHQSTHVAMLRIQGMTCGVCSAAVENTLKKAVGVREANVSYATHTARVQFEPSNTSVDDLLEAVEDIGFGAELIEEQRHNVKMVGNGDAAPLVVEIRVRGMTCAACSGTVERHLKGLGGVQRATVSLVLSRAFVVCDPAKWTADGLCSEIEDVGFDAEVERITDSTELSGRAQLHMELLDGETTGLVEFTRSLEGVTGCRLVRPRAWEVMYDPHIVGARRLLENLGDKYPVKWANIGMRNDQLQMHLTEMLSLRRSLAWAVAPATLAFIFTILLPALGYHNVGFLGWPVHPPLDVLTLLMFLMATPVQFSVAKRFHLAAWRALKRKSPNMDVLVSVATNVAYFYSAGLIMFCLFAQQGNGAHELVVASVHFLSMGPILIAVVLLGKFLEAHAKLRAMKTLCDLPASRPEFTVLCNDKGEETPIPVELVQLGDALRVFVGGKIAVDGTVCSDVALHVDESLLTGESTPVLKAPGDLVLGGTTCVSGGCLMRVTKVGCETTLGQMELLVQEAQASKAGIQRVADMVARIFVPSVVTLAFATFVIWSSLVFSGVVTPKMGSMHHSMVDSMQSGHDDSEMRDSLKLLFAVKFGMAVLMIACPCAMGLATPMAVMVSTGVAAKRGCLIKSAAALETAAGVDAVVLDKTGTITSGSPAISSAVCVAGGFQQYKARWSAGPGKKMQREGIASLGRCSVTASDWGDRCR
jgi:Cu+-exporting ATPase